jgi:hypothetical protein
MEEEKKESPKKRIDWLNVFLIVGVPIISVLIVSYFKGCSR